LTQGAESNSGAAAPGDPAWQAKLEKHCIEIPGAARERVAALQREEGARTWEERERTQVHARTADALRELHALEERCNEMMRQARGAGVSIQHLNEWTRPSK
jgi:hypothetical protein